MTLGTATALSQSALLWSLECVRLPTPSGPKPFGEIIYGYQASLLADRSQRQLVLKSRQVGITTVAAIRMLHEAIYQPRSLGLIISRDQSAAQDVIGKVVEILDDLDDAPALVKENQSELAFDNGSRIVSQAATAKAGRGYTATSVVLDEFAFAEYAERIYRAVSPTLARGGRLTVISTPNGQANLFSRLWSAQEGGEWSRHKIPWRDCPAFDDAWYERERPKYSEQAWASEFECDFVASGGAVFDPNDVDAMRDGWAGLQGPQERHRYVTGVDLGRRHDPSVLITLDVTEVPSQVVAYERLLRAPYAQSQAAIDARAALYGGETWVESNSIGDPIIEGLECDARPFMTTAKSKADALQRLLRAVEQRELCCGVEQVLAELKGYQWDDQNIVQDSVMALAIAMHAMQERGEVFVEMAVWDALSGHIPPLGLVDAGAHLVAAVDRPDAGDEYLVVAVTRHWLRERQQDVAVRAVHKLDRQGVEQLLRELKPIHTTYTGAVGMEPLMQQLRAGDGLWTEAFPSSQLVEAVLSLRECIVAGRVAHGGDAGLRASFEAASLDTGASPKMVGRRGDTGLVQTLAMAATRALELNLRGGPQRD